MVEVIHERVRWSKGGNIALSFSRLVKQEPSRLWYSKVSVLAVARLYMVMGLYWCYKLAEE